MNYDIKILGEDEDRGLIEFDRLAKLTQSTKDIACKALMLDLRGYSDINPDKHLKKALNMYLQHVSGSEQEGTFLTIDCEYFSETIRGLQFDLFKPKESVLRLTPMALVIRSFQHALEDESMMSDLDKPLLRSLMNFKRNFISGNEIFYLSNRGSIAEVKLTKDDFQKIEILEESIPEPQNVIVNGQLDEIKISKGRLGMMTEEGMVNLVVKDNSSIQELLGFMGKEITIKGKSHFKPNGALSFVEIVEFGEALESDKYFSTIPNAAVSNQQVLFQLKESKRGNSFDALKDLSGLMKEDIDENKFQEMIKDIHR
jgi:hypothetical protein